MTTFARPWHASLCCCSVNSCSASKQVRRRPTVWCHWPVAPPRAAKITRRRPALMLFPPGFCRLYYYCCREPPPDDRTCAHYKRVDWPKSIYSDFRTSTTDECVSYFKTINSINIDIRRITRVHWLILTRLHYFDAPPPVVSNFIKNL